MRVLVTGSSGLIGSALAGSLANAGIEAIGYDLRRAPEEDILNTGRLEQALGDVDGVVHLAAISRVVMGEMNPARCVAVNVQALGTLLKLLEDSTMLDTLHRREKAPRGRVEQGVGDFFRFADQVSFNFAPCRVRDGGNQSLRIRMTRRGRDLFARADFH